MIKRSRSEKLKMYRIDQKLAALAALAIACSAPVEFPSVTEADTETTCPPGTIPTVAPPPPLPPPQETTEETPAVDTETSDTKTSDPSSTDSAEECDNLTILAQEILVEDCHTCHQPGGQASLSGIPDILKTDDMIASGKLVPGEPYASLLFTRVKADTMPPVDQDPRPSTDDIDVLEDWISCIEPDANCDNPFVSVEQMLDEILVDVQGLSTVDRPFARYLSFTHLSNEGVCQEDISLFRYAARRTVNGLSTNPLLTNPKPIDGAALIYRIDLRDYDWDQRPPHGRDGYPYDDDDDDGYDGFNDLWDLLIHHNRFAVQYVQEDALTIAEFVRERNFVIHADWLTHDANTGQLYYDMARVPGTLRGIEARLGIDISDNIRARRVKRIGFRDSGVSDQNRIIERHQLPGGSGQSLWISYDFADNGGSENVFSNPLDFEEDGGELIFSQPNGLTAFAITAANGDVLDGAATSIVVDPLQQDSVVRPGISCLSCHDRGYIPADDEILSFVLLSQDFVAGEKELVAALHPNRTDSALVIAQDTARYIASERALLPPTRTEVLPPVPWAFYEWDADLDLKKAAAELGLQEIVFLRNIGGLDPELAPLGTPSGKITREVWERFFADIVCQLNIGFAHSRFCYNGQTKFNLRSCRLAPR